jgi:hypothetical protein
MDHLLSAPSPILPFPRLGPLTSRNNPARMRDPVPGQELSPYPGDATLPPDRYVSRSKVRNTVDAVCLVLMERPEFERRCVAEGAIATAFGQCLRHRETAPGRPSHG